ncbi:hypothetical protein [Novosphingobium panipatense]|uniref:hypothetical protein n=1 Tax=Novosphingobium panipatense TaxID=428991 RepID=UPI003618F823
MLRATCDPARFLDLIENFLLFDEVPGGLRKIIGKYHQVLGVNRAIQAVDHIKENQGKLGVFWHTQGSGKSLSMVMFAEKVLRRLGATTLSSSSLTVPSWTTRSLDSSPRQGRSPRTSTRPRRVAAST